MLKMIMADDERVIRETISQMLDWECLGIELIGVCKNGIEVYNMILDESPDIVMTDIRMPGLSGLEVVREIAPEAEDWEIQRELGLLDLAERSCPGMKSLNTPGKP